MPTYRTERSDLDGNPIIEILSSEGFPYDEHFRFGIEKAKLILTCIELIEAFCESDGERPETDETIAMFRKSLGVACKIQKHESFTTSFGKRVDQPYLKLLHKDRHIGFGLRKAMAILAVEQDIRKFVKFFI